MYDNKKWKKIEPEKSRLLYVCESCLLSLILRVLAYAWDFFYTWVQPACKKSLIDKNKNSISAELKVSSFNMEMMHLNPIKQTPGLIDTRDALFLTRFDLFRAAFTCVFYAFRQVKCCTHSVNEYINWRWLCAANLVILSFSMCFRLFDHQ